MFCCGHVPLCNSFLSSLSLSLSLSLFLCLSTQGRCWLARNICGILDVVVKPGCSDAFHWSLHLTFTQEALEVSAGVAWSHPIHYNSSWACVAKGHRDLYGLPIPGGNPFWCFKHYVILKLLKNSISTSSWSATLWAFRSAVSGQSWKY